MFKDSKYLLDPVMTLSLVANLKVPKKKKKKQCNSDVKDWRHKDGDKKTRGCKNDHDDTSFK